MAKVLKICWGPWENASRDKRELSVYRELGHEVLVMASGAPKDRGRRDLVDSFHVERWGNKPLGEHVSTKINQILSFITWGMYARKYHPDVISGHDFTGWIVGWMANMFRRKKPLFIYDAHEFELGRNPYRKKISTWIIQHLEKYIIKKSAFSIMVNNSIAEEVQKVYKLEQYPVVVRNTPNYWIIDEKTCAINHQRLQNLFTSRNIKFLIMYHGGILPGRGVEVLIDALSELDNEIGLVVLGNGQDFYLEKLKKHSEEIHVQERVLFHPAVPITDLWKYVGAVDISCAPIEIIAKNHYFSLPNKFFESIQSQTPIIASNVPEMKRIIDYYNIGLTCIPGDSTDLAKCIQRLREDSDFYLECKNNLLKAKEELCWEKEKNILVKAYNKFIEQKC